MKVGAIFTRALALYINLWHFRSIDSSLSLSLISSSPKEGRQFLLQLAPFRISFPTPSVGPRLVGKVHQIINKNNSELVSEYDLSVSLIPVLLLRVKGAVVTSAELTVIAPETWEMTVRGTKVNGSNVPFLDQYLDYNAVEIPVGEAYKAISGSIPAAVLKTFYVDEGMRITRDIDENFFDFTRA